MTIELFNMSAEKTNEYNATRYVENGGYAHFFINSSTYITNIPVKGRLYNLVCKDGETTILQKNVIFNGYNFCMDGSGATPTVTDNTLVFLNVE